MYSDLAREIELCTLCKKEATVASFVTYKKPLAFVGSDSATVMLIGHSPTVRTKQEAEVVLKMNLKNQPLYKYIRTKILDPLMVPDSALYCTNLLKCKTTRLPEDTEDKDAFFTLATENCLCLLEDEIRAVKPKLIISLSQRVLSVLSAKYLGRPMTMRDSFGKMFELAVDRVQYPYVPVVHLPKGAKSIVARHYLHDQTERLKALAVRIDQSSYLADQLNRIQSAKALPFDQYMRTSLPEVPGVYVILEKRTNEALYVGRTTDLRQRIYNNHLMGPLENARLKKYLIDSQKVTDIQAAKEYIQANCAVTYVKCDDYRNRGMIEGYLTGLLKPVYGIDHEH